MIADLQELRRRAETEIGEPHAAFDRSSPNARARESSAAF
jgi:hypothetical protein